MQSLDTCLQSLDSVKKLFCSNCSNSTVLTIVYPQTRNVPHIARPGMGHLRHVEWGAVTVLQEKQHAALEHAVAVRVKGEVGRLVVEETLA